MARSVKNKAAIVAVMGASGSGKSAWVKQELARVNPARLLIWDPMNEYAGHGEACGKLGALVARVAAAGKKGPFRQVFNAAADPKLRTRQFDVVCGLAMAAGNCTLLVEELKFVTTPSRAPLPWSRVCLTGRHHGLTVIGISQRPASIDKDFLGNATVIHTGRLNYPEDRRAVANAMGISIAEIEALLPLHYIEKNMQTGEKCAGELTFGK